MRSNTLTVERAHSMSPDKKRDSTYLHKLDIEIALQNETQKN
jgi:hypothetical protein